MDFLDELAPVHKKRIAFAGSQDLEIFEKTKKIEKIYIFSDSENIGNSSIQELLKLDTSEFIQIGSDDSLKALQLPAITEKLNLKKIEIQEKYFVEKFKPIDTTDELPGWENVATFGQEISFGTGKVIRGKGVGRTIGIPTANLDFGPEKIQKHDLIPGIYYGRCMLTSDPNLPESLKSLENKSMPMVMSIGYNLQYNQRSINYEVLVLLDFGKEEFYDAKMKVFLQGFIRAESKFPTFDMFIRAMECDVVCAKKHINLHGLM